MQCRFMVIDILGQLVVPILMGQAGHRELFHDFHS